MIKISIKLDKRRRLNSGRFPLKFKVARKDSAIYIPTGYELKEDEWDAKNEKVKGIPRTESYQYEAYEKDFPS